MAPLWGKQKANAHPEELKKSRTGAERRLLEFHSFETKSILGRGHSVALSLSSNPDWTCSGLS